MFEIFHTVFRYKEKESPDQLGYYPVRTHIPAMPERRYLWTSRALVVVASFSIAINMILASTIYLLMPQRTVKPQLFYINKYFNEMQMVEPSEINYPVSDLITEENIRNYIYMRYYISTDYDELKERWARGSIVYWLSSPVVYKNFAEHDVEYSIMQFRENSLQRDVEIEWVRPLATSIWQVQFRTLDYYPYSTEPTINIWRATLRVVYVDIPFKKKEDAIINPFGFIVDNFSLAFHGTPTTSAHYLETAKRVTEGGFR